MRYSAVIFDLDGTVLENEEVYAKAFSEVLQKYGVDIEDLDHKHPQTPGIGIRANWENLKKRFKEVENVSVSQLVFETQDAYHTRLKDVVIRPGLFELLDALKSEEVRVALATSNDWWLVEDELEDLDLHKHFEVLVTGDEVAERKPEPDIFFETARRLGVEARECVVIEDSVAGIKAAKKAGMVAIAVLTDFSKPGDFPEADLIIEGFEGLTPKKMDSFFQN